MKPSAKTVKHPTFADFALNPVLLAEIKRAEYQKPSAIQREVIPAVLSGKDVLARAKTGSGKTAAFVLPLLQNLINESQSAKKLRTLDKNIKKSGNVKIIVLAPTRELAIQIREEFERFSSGFKTQEDDSIYKGKTTVETPANIKPLRCLSAYGGVKINPQMIALRGGADVLVATPGRLLDLVSQNSIRLQSVKALVVDEVDRLMKGDFAEEIDQIFKLLPNKRQNLMFTATFPESIRKLVRHTMQEPEIINVDDGEFTLSIPSDTDNKNSKRAAIKQRVITVNHERKNDLLAHLLKQNDWKQVLIFCSAKRTCDNLVRKLEKRDIKASAMHGNLQQNARARALKEFKEGSCRILIATDVAGRGVDIQQLPCVINYELPRSPNDYVHRIGRTGRAGEVGEAISLIAHQDYAHFRVIEKRNGLRLEREQIAGFEADKEAPPLPTSNKTKKKKAKKKSPSKLAKKAEQKAEKKIEKLAKTKASQSTAVDTKKTSKPNQPNKNHSSTSTETSTQKDQPVNTHIWGNKD